MEFLDNVVYSCIVSFLTTREYVLGLLVSKNMQEKFLLYKKWRMPFITANFLDGFANAYNKVVSYHFKYEYQPINKDSNVVINTLLKFGNKCLRHEENITIYAVPWMFRNGFDSKHLSICEKEYVIFKLEKYEKKTTETPFLSGFYFEKLLRKRKQLELYLKTRDEYMIECEEYLEDKINKKA